MKNEWLSSFPCSSLAIPHSHHAFISSSLHRVLASSHLIVMASLLLLPLGCSAERPPRIEDYVPRSAIVQRDAGEASAMPALSEPLALDACVRIALDNNPVQRAAREGVAAAQHAIGEARSAYYPRIDGIVGFSRLEAHNLLQLDSAGIPGFTGDISPRNSYIFVGILTYTLYDFGNRRAQLKAAMARRGVAEGELLRARQDIALNVYRAFYALQVAQEARAVAQKSVERAADNAMLARERRILGAAPEIDVLRAEVDLAQARLDLVRATSQLRTARGNLNTAMGLPVEMAVDVRPPPDRLVSPETIDLPAALEQAVHLRPELMSSLNRVDEARRSVAAARSAFGPRISLDAVYLQQGEHLFPEGQAWLYGVFASYPLFEGLLKVRRLSRTKAELAQAEANTAGAVLQVRSDVWLAHSRLSEAYEAVNAADVLVQRAEESYRTVRERYRNEAAIVNELLDAQTALARAEASAVQARWQYRTAEAEFRRAVGTLAGNDE